MTKGYWIGRVDIDDPEQYKKYTIANGAPFVKYGAKFLARAGQMQAIEGSARMRKCGDRISELPGRARLLAFARIPGSDEAAGGRGDRGSRHHRRL